MAMNTVVVLENEDGTSGLDKKLRGTEGIAHITDVGRPGQSHNRFIEDVAETQATIGHITWTEAEEVYNIRLRATQGQGAGLAAGNILRVVFDASPVDDITDDTQAWAWLTAATGAAATDVEYFEVVVALDASADTAGSDGVWSEWFQFSYPLRRLDITYPGGTAAASANTIDIFVETA